MGQDYDKILKENIAAIFLPLAEKYMGLHIKEAKELTGKLQVTLEREPDFLRLIKDWEGKKYILHMEFQVTDDPDMAYRMAEYKAILQRKYKLPVKQAVIYLGEKKPKMRTELLPEERIDGFLLADLKGFDHGQLLRSDIPEEVLLAILGDFGKVPPEQVIAKVIQRLIEVSGDNIKLEKYGKQLGVLSRLRKLEVETRKQINDMPINYDIKTDGLYLEGKRKAKEELEAKFKARLKIEVERKIKAEREKARDRVAKIKAEAEEKAAAKAKAEAEAAKKQFVKNLLSLGTMDEKQIAQVANVALKFVREVKKEG